MEIRIDGIISKQYISAKSGSGSLSIVDMASAETVQITLYKQTVDDSIIEKKQRQNWVFSGCVMRTFEGRSYLTADAIGVAQAAKVPEKVPA